MPNEERTETGLNSNFVTNCIGYNLQWLDTILRDTGTDASDKISVGQKVTTYLHMIEAEARRYYDI